jgi:hypothetical protein
MNSIIMNNYLYVSITMIFTLDMLPIKMSYNYIDEVISGTYAHDVILTAGEVQMYNTNHTHSRSYWEDTHINKPGLMSSMKVSSILIFV